MSKIFSQKKSEKGSLMIIIILIIILMVSVFGIVILSSMSRKKAEQRANQRASDLKTLREAVENHKLYYGIYPSSGLNVLKLEKRSSMLTYTNERWNECDKPNDWIPNLSIDLPHDPTNSCKNKTNRYPRYEYVSDGYDYKIISYQLIGEICDKEEHEELVDPARPCNRYDASWAVYSPGAEKW